MARPLPVVQTKHLVAALQKDGWYVERTSRHIILRHPDKAGSVPVSNHPSAAVPRAPFAKS